MYLNNRIYLVSFECMSEMVVFSFLNFMFHIIQKAMFTPIEMESRKSKSLKDKTFYAIQFH